MQWAGGMLSEDGLEPFFSSCTWDDVWWKWIERSWGGVMLDFNSMKRHFNWYMFGNHGQTWKYMKTLLMVLENPMPLHTELIRYRNLSFSSLLVDFFSCMIATMINVWVFAFVFFWNVGIMLSSWNVGTP